MNIAQEPLPYFERQGLILDSGLKPTERFVLMIINEYSSADGTGAFPKQKTIADKTGYSRETVNRSIKKLESKQIISQIHNYREDHGLRNSNYIVHWDSLKKCGQEHKIKLDTPVTENHKGCDGGSQGPVTEDHNISTHIDLPNSSHLYRTAFSSKSAVSDFQDVFYSSDQGELEDNCATTLANPSTNRHIPNSQKEKQRSGSSKKPNKPKKRKLFDGTYGLSCDRNGWIELPKTIDTAPEYRELMGKAKAQTLVWMKDYMAFRYPGELDVEVAEWTDGSFTISGKDFGEMPYNEFLGKDGPMSAQLMRDVIMERTGGFQEEFNEQMNEYFWDAWHKFTKKAA